MKKVLTLLVLAFAAFQLSSAQTNVEKISKLTEGIVNVGDATLNENNPIVSISPLAEAQAESSIVLTKENVVEAFSKGQDYSKALIIVGQHTLVKITDWADCQASGAWGTCMPKGEGYVKKGELQEKADYINNIIGIPDNQTRTLYLFK